MSYIDVRKEYQPIFIENNEEQELYKIGDVVNNDINQCKNSNRRTVPNNSKRSIQNKRPTPLINLQPERNSIGKNNFRRNKNFIPGNTKCNELVLYSRKAYVLGTTMVKGIRRK